ncbi:MAG: helix-turn-helix domain-containing protein [Gaiellaceae bacterium]
MPTTEKQTAPDARGEAPEAALITHGQGSEPIGEPREPFAMVPSWLIRSGASDRAVRLYALLADHLNRDTGQCNPGRKRLAAILECHTDTLDRAMDELKGLRGPHGMAVKVSRESTGRKADTNSYALPDQSVPVRTGQNDQSVPLRPDQSVPMRPKPYEGEPDAVLRQAQNGSVAAANGPADLLDQPPLADPAAPGEANPVSSRGEDVLPLDENAKRARALRLGLDQREAA